MGMTGNTQFQGEKVSSEDIAGLVTAYKENARQALHFQQRAYFNMVALLEALTGNGDKHEIEQILTVAQNLLY